MGFDFAYLVRPQVLHRTRQLNIATSRHRNVLDDFRELGILRHNCKLKVNNFRSLCEVTIFFNCAVQSETANHSHSIWHKASA